MTGKPKLKQMEKPEFEKLMLKVHSAVRNPTAQNRKFINKLVSQAITSYKGTKSLAVFISYHQQSGASDTNAIYDYLISVGFSHDHVFFDKISLTNIQDLTKMVPEAIVLMQIQTLQVFFRPFTLIEAYEAICCNIPILPVALESYDFQVAKQLFEQEEFAVVLEKENPGASIVLEELGLNINDVGKAIGKIFPSLISLPYRATDMKIVRHGELENIVLRLMRQILQMTMLGQREE